MKQIKILVSFEDNEMIFPNIEFVKNDYNHIEFIFDFDDDDGKKVFELKKPNGKVFIKEIIDNKVVLSDLDEKGNIIPVINQSGKYEFEITKYKSDSKFTINKTCHFVARDEVVNVDDEIVDKDASLPILNDLITSTIALKENTEKVGQLTKEKGDYAEEQGNYAKEAASNVINANNQVTKLINNFESKVNEYTSVFNKNATTKQEEFDSNSTTKINEYNDNTTSKLKKYNDNHEVKMKNYNDNASEKTKAFNSNAEVKTTVYDKNADDKLSAYNTNDATKLEEYNDNATLKIEEYNSNATQKLEEYDEHSEELNNKINSTNSELEKLKDEILEIGEVSDSYIRIEDSTMSKLKSLSIDGVCEQETTTGKNLCDATLLPITQFGITISKNNTGDIIINGTPDYSEGYKQFNIGAKKTLEPGTYTTSVENKKNGLGIALGGFDGQLNLTMSGVEKTKTSTATKIYNISPQINISYDAGTFKNYIFNPMIEKSAIATKYEPYTGGQPSPSLDYPQEIKTITDSLNVTSCNKNMFKMNDNYSKGYTTTKNGITLKVEDDLSISLKGTTTDRTEFFLFGSWSVRNNSYLPKEIFTISQNGFVDGITSNLSFFKNGNNIQNYGLTYIKTSNIFNLSLIEFDGISYAIAIAEGKTIDTRVYIQIESGKKTTSFEEQLQSQITANLPEDEFIGNIDSIYKDTLSIELQDDETYHLILNKMIFREIYDGSEDWAMTYGEHMFNLRTSSKFIPRINSYSNYCIYNPVQSYIYNTLKDNEFALQKFTSNKNSSYTLFLKFMSINNVKEFKNWLSTHKMEIYYVLEEPYKIDLGIVDMPFSFDEVTNIFTDSDLLPKINATYYKNFISTIRNLKVNNETLKNELMSINNRLAVLENANVNAVNDEVIEESEVTEK